MYVEGVELKDRQKLRCLQNCSEAWKANDGGANPISFSGKAGIGLFGMVCSHEVCLKLINLYKSGEQLVVYRLSSTLLVKG